MAENITSVLDLLAKGKVTADDMIAQMKTMGDNATHAFDAVFLESGIINWPEIQPVVRQPNSPAPGYAYSAQNPVEPASVDVSGISAPSFSEPPDLALAAPSFSAPTAPSAVLPAAPSGTVPEFHVPALPNAPTLTLPAVPTFQTLSIPVAPAVDIPNFTATLESDTLTAPTETFNYVEQPYQDALLDELKLKLMSDLVNGGYGIEPNDEAGLWSRAKDREQRNTEAAYQEAARQAAARGFMLPPGALFAQLEAARQDSLEKMSALSRDIMLKRSDLYVENRKFTITEVREVEQMLITYFGYMMERALNVAKATVEMGIKVFEARVAQSNYKLERFKAQASVYEVVLKASLAHLEEYKARIEGLRATVDVQRVQAEVYRTQVEGVTSMANLYRTQIEAVKAQVEIEQMRLNAFRSSIEIYSAQVGAKVAEFGLFEAQLKGALAPTEVYKAQVDAYASRVGAYKGKVDAQVAVLSAQLEPAKLRIEKYRADIAKYSSQIQRYSTQLQGDVSLYESRTRAYVSANELNMKYSSLNVEQSKAQADVALAVAKQYGDLVVAKGSQMISAAHAFAAVQASLSNAYGSVGASALSVSSGLLVNSGQG